MSLELTFYVTNPQNISTSFEKLIIGHLTPKDLNYFASSFIQKQHIPLMPLKLLNPSQCILDNYTQKIASIRTYIDDFNNFPSFLSLPDDLPSYLENAAPNLQNFVTFTRKISPNITQNLCSCGLELPEADAENVVFDGETGDFTCKCGKRIKLCSLCGPKFQFAHCRACQLCHHQLLKLCNAESPNKCVFCTDPFVSGDAWRNMGCGCKAHFQCFADFDGSCFQCKKGANDPVLEYSQRSEKVLKWVESDVQFSIFNQDVIINELICKKCKTVFFDFNFEFCHKCFSCDLRQIQQYKLDSKRFLDFIENNIVPNSRPDELRVYVYFHQFFQSNTELFQGKINQLRTNKVAHLDVPSLAEMQEFQLRTIENQNRQKEKLQRETAENEAVRAKYQQQKADEARNEQEKLESQTRESEELIKKIFNPKVREMIRKKQEKQENKNIENSESDDLLSDFSSEIDQDVLDAYESPETSLDSELQQFLDSNPPEAIPELDPDFVYDPKMFQLFPDEEEHQPKYPESFLTDLEKAQRDVETMVKQQQRSDQQQNIGMPLEQQALIIAALLGGHK
ncbi:hypothetical protein SS50377_22334 [Spironucleus salmonicida]|uniref:Uncharacterized protein n=1 Tax=Spironucleus salmonicida TaxID=348837 RepID=V6LCK2_9EUKA|nr:hypothetical protein SS50377_22334 [Spironucleus salmonicida]|eukprot:EST42172.1 Hypothetical protein SS50377_18478 [Spironucleus salmonicida]